MKPTPFGGAEPAAPRFSRQRPTLPGVGEEPPSVFDALTEGFRLTSPEEGFTPPDPDEPFRNVQAELLRQQGPVFEAQGDVRFRLGATDFEMDQLYYNRDTGVVEARGNILATQENARLRADYLRYEIPTEPLQIPDGEVAPLGPADDLEQERLKLGHVTAENLQLVEPYRGIRAESLDYNLATRSGTMEDPEGYLIGLMRGNLVGIYFGADRIQMTGPQTGRAEGLWVTPDDRDPPNFRIKMREATLSDGKAVGRGARLQLGRVDTPIYWPKWTYRLGAAGGLGFEFDTGRAAELGYYLNYGQRVYVDPEMDLGIRLYPTENEGVGFGFDGEYDFTRSPAHPLFLGEGQFRTMGTTESSGFIEWYHRHLPFEDTVLLMQWEQWFEDDFVKNFYYDEYRHRTEPRTFANITYTQPDYVASGTVRASTHDFVAETERLPEGQFHLLERPLVENVYFTYDTVDGYVEREPSSDHAFRSIHVARLTLDLDLHEALTVAPFLEVEGGWYSKTFESGESDGRLSNTVGTTLQTRFHRSYPGAIGFSGFKHLVVPSFTYSYRPESTMAVDETLRFDAYDNVYGRSRFETKIDNIVFGRDAETQESWQVARLTLYQGNDFWNEIRKTDDYEVELDVRPRPWWGLQFVGERHQTGDEFDLDAPFSIERLLLNTFEDITRIPVDPELVYRYNARYADYDRVLSLVYYDDTVYDGRFNARAGFAYTETRDTVFNREVLYGAGYRLSDRWSLAFEHRYDFERNDLYRQFYEVRRKLHTWEVAVQFRDRTEGWDVGVEFSLIAFPGTGFEF